MKRCDKVRLAVVGASQRGLPMMSLILEMDDVEIVGVSDLYQDRIVEAVEQVKKATGKAPKASKDYRDLLDIEDLDAVFTPSSWTSHAQICIDAMNAGKYAASEVGGATSINQCWELLHTSQRTGKPFMLMENCCYGREEMAVLNMIRKGLFGELVHAEGGYRHDLRDEVSTGREIRHYRLDNYMHRNGDLYPTHDLGPIAKYLHINRGNRMVTLSSMASKAAGLNEWNRTNRGADHPFSTYPFAQGDVVVTNIKCAHGEVITLFHDTTLPRPYSRANLLQGTKGIWQEDKYGVYFDGISKVKHEWESIEKYYKKYDHPVWKEFQKEGVKGGHGGMDWLVLRAFIEAVKNGTDTPIDAYDSVSWMAITCLSEESCAMGGMPVAIPDFTDGAWLTRGLSKKSKYSLDNW